MTINKIHTSGAPEPAGHYSQAVVCNSMVFISGQLPIVPGTGEKLTGPVGEQTLQVLKNIKAITEAAGSDISKIVKVTVYISDIELWSEVNKTYSSFFGDHKPARAIVPVKDLHYGCKIEMEAIAAL
ncbi:MAG: enamine deaminase RidA [Odoribacter sp.]|nr:enamine deaminase RidA [Odoribacter sp.]